MLTIFDIKSGLCHFRAEILRIVFKLVSQFSRFAQKVQNCNAGSSNGRCKGIGKQIRTAPLAKNINDLFSSARKSATCSTKSFTECSGDDIDSSHYSPVFMCTTTRFSHEA